MKGRKALNTTTLLSSGALALIGVAKLATNPLWVDLVAVGSIGLLFLLAYALTKKMAHQSTQHAGALRSTLPTNETYYGRVATLRDQNSVLGKNGILSTSSQAVTIRFDAAEPVVLPWEYIQSVHTEGLHGPATRGGTILVSCTGEKVLTMRVPDLLASTKAFPQLP
jgi:hypothetical protein